MMHTQSTKLLPCGDQRGTPTGTQHTDSTNHAKRATHSTKMYQKDKPSTQ